MIEVQHPLLSVTRQCRLLGLPRSEPKENLRLMRLIDETYLAYPFFGSRQMARWLRRQGECFNRKRVQRLMRQMGLEAIYQKLNLSRANAAHRVYPHLLRHLAVTRPNQVWATDITYVPVQGGYAYHRGTFHDEAELRERAGGILQFAVKGFIKLSEYCLLLHEGVEDCPVSATPRLNQSIAPNFRTLGVLDVRVGPF